MAAPVNATQVGHNPGFKIGSIFGIPIFLHPSWFIIFGLITFSLGFQFTSQHPHWSSTDHWTLGIITSVLFFGSVVFHELSHSVVAMHYKVPVKSITLFVFGGISSIEQEPASGLQEFNIAIAGPVSSLVLAGVFWLIHMYVGNEMITSAAKWLAWINLILGIFNLVPGFPLDGGRVLRGIAWGVTRNFDRATRIATLTGQAIAYLMILYGIFEALRGNWVAGLWTAFIGWFLLSAAQESYMQVAVRRTLTGVRAADIMTKEIPTVPRDMSLEEYVHEVLRTGQRFHIVTGLGEPVGLITIRAAQSVPREEWERTSLQAVMLPVKDIHAATIDEPAIQVLERMQKENVNSMPVMSDGHIVGMIGRDAILRALQTRLQMRHLVAH
jgi:Zn-dependent protease/predicted transcriptional regulator